jgi:putative exosortase-associated protein (TIGR04073 family)
MIYLLKKEEVAGMRMISISLIALFIIGLAGDSFAATTNITPARGGAGMASTKSKVGVAACAKIERGLAKIAVAATEVPKAIIDTTKETKNPIWGLTGGALKGTSRAFPKAVSGAYDLATFPASGENIPEVSTEPLAKEGVKEPQKQAVGQTTQAAEELK